MKNTARHSRNQRIHLNHEKHEKWRIFYPQMSQMDTDERHEGGSRDSWVGAAVPADRLYAFRLWRPTLRRWITSGGPPGANWEKQCFVCRGNLDSLRFPLASLLQNFFDGLNDGIPPCNHEYSSGL